MPERYAIFTSTYIKNGHIPTVMLESERHEAVLRYRESKERSREKWGNKRDELWAANMYGNSYTNIETGNYDKTTKSRIDAIIRTGKLPANEERKIIEQHAVWSRIKGESR